MNRVEFPQTIFGFFGILMSKSPHKVWDLEHFLMLQKINMTKAGINGEGIQIKEEEEDAALASKGHDG